MKSAIEIIKESFGLFFKRENLDYFVKVGLVSLGINIISLIPNYMEMFGYSTEITTERIDAIFSNPIALITVPIITLLVVVMSIWSQASNTESVKRVLVGEEMSFQLTFKTSWKYLGRFFLVNLLFTLIILGGFLLLIIPAFIFGTFYSFVMPAFISGKGVIESFKYSRNLVRGRFWKVFWLQLKIGVLFFVIGIILAFIPYSLGSLVTALFSGLFILPNFILYKELEKNPVQI